MASIVNQMTQVSWMCGQKKPSFFYVVQKKPIFKYRQWLKVKEEKKCILANRSMEQADVVILICDKIYEKLKLIRTDKERHFILIKGAVN